MLSLKLTISNQAKNEKNYWHLYKNYNIRISICQGFYTTNYLCIYKKVNHLLVYLSLWLPKKLILSNTEWTNLSAERTFLFSENKFCFRFFPRQVGCLNSFSATGRIFFPRQVGYNRDFFIKTSIIIKTASGFF